MAPRNEQDQDWPQHRMYVLECLERIEKKLDDVGADVLNLKIMAAVWGAVAGLLAWGIPQIVTILLSGVHGK